MKKKLFSLFLALVASVGTMFAEKIKIGDLYYQVESSHSTAVVTYKSCIGTDYFNGDWTITTANIPASVTYEGKKYTVGLIGGSAFRSTSLTSVTIPNSVKKIDPYAFYDCDQLTSITIPNSVTSIGRYAFQDCDKLTSVTIGNSVESIGDRAFLFCDELTSVTIPNSVTSIGASAFQDCESLTSVTIEAETPPTLGNNVFHYTNICPIYVPCNAVNAYKSAPGWNLYADRIRGNCASYTITFKNWDGSILQSTQVEKGEIPQYTGTTPTKPDDSQYTYTFSGWTPQIVAATADATYKATFSSVVNVYTISVSAVNGQVIGGGEYQYGATIDLTAIPNEGYVFDQWSDGVKDNPRTITVTGDAEYTALFTSTEGFENIYTSKPVQKVIIDQKVYILRNGKTYTMQGQEVK